MGVNKCSFFLSKNTIYWELYATLQQFGYLKLKYYHRERLFKCKHQSKTRNNRNVLQLNCQIWNQTKICIIVKSPMNLLYTNHDLSKSKTFGCLHSQINMQFSSEHNGNIRMLKLQEDRKMEREFTFSTLQNQLQQIILSLILQ